MFLLGMLTVNQLTSLAVLKARPVFKLLVRLTVPVVYNGANGARAQISLLPPLQFSLHYSTHQSKETSAVVFSTQ